MHQRGRGQPLAEAGEALHVAEQDRHVAARSARIGQFRAVDQPGDDARIEVFAEGVADPRLDPQFADHVVEGLGQAADLVARGDRDDRIERPLLDGGCAGEEAAHRPHEAGRDRGRDNQAEQTGDRQQREADFDDTLLIGAGAEDRGAGEASHFDARRLDAAVEIVAPAVELGEDAAFVGALPRGGGRQQLRENRFVATPLLLQEFDMRVEPGQRDIVVEIDRVGDQLIEALARLGELLVACVGGGPDSSSQILDLCRIRRRAFVERQKQPADIGRFLDRMDVGLRQAHIGREIVLVEDDQLGIDGAGHAHAEPGHRAHQQQQADGDAEDLGPDRDAHAAPAAALMAGQIPNPEAQSTPPARGRGRAHPSRNRAPRPAGGHNARSSRPPPRHRTQPGRPGEDRRPCRPGSR